MRRRDSRPRSVLTGTSPCREQVREALPLLVALAERMRSGEPLDARGVARLKTLLSDRRGPCYLASRAGVLANALHEVSDLLTTRSD